MARNRFVLLALAAVGPALISWACSSGANTLSGTGGTPGSGGVVSSGGSPGTGGAGTSCPNVTACGGDLVGTWTVTSSCLKVSGNLDLSQAAGPGCPPTPVTGDLQVTGSWTANSDGTTVDNTTTSGTEQFKLAPACLVISSTPVSCTSAAGLLTGLGYSSLSCPSTADGGCDCTATVHQAGGIGLVSPGASTSGNYTLSGNQVTVSGDSGDTQYSYCASANTITLTPQSTSPTMAGTIVLQRGAASGSGGAVGTGGQVGSGGTTGSGGQPGSGGTTGTGGRGGSGGAIGSGGASGAGGQAGKSGSGGVAGGAGGTAGNAAGGTAGKGTGGSAGATGAVVGPCDIYANAGNPCVAAHSTVRALFGAYSGKLYQVRNTAGATKDILTLSPGGFADGGSQDTFCSGTTCVITVVYDQSTKGNNLWYQGSTMVAGSTSSLPSKATSESLTLSGHKVYSLYINPNNSYWVDASKSGIALGADPEGMYMVTSGKHWNSGCCFDYGNSETDRTADGAGTMDTINFSGSGEWGSGAGAGPWVKADLEYGVFTDNVNNSHQNAQDPTQTSPYVTAILKNNGKTEWALRGGDASTGPLGTYFKGTLPGGGYSPMKKQGAIVLGSGGDCCKPGGGANLSDGTFYEGCIVTGYPSDATEDAVQANVVAAGYGK